MGDIDAHDFGGVNPIGFGYKRFGSVGMPLGWALEHAGHLRQSGPPRHLDGMGFNSSCSHREPTSPTLHGHPNPPTNQPMTRRGLPYLPICFVFHLIAIS
jgi:hypothetical protein